MIFLKLLQRLAVILGIMLAPIATAAHEGAHASRIVSDVGNVTAEGGRISMSITVANYSEAEVILLSVFAQNAEAVPITPTIIGPGDQYIVDVSLFFEDAIPSIFAVFLDFGEDGTAPALVIN